MMLLLRQPLRVRSALRLHIVAYQQEKSLWRKGMSTVGHTMSWFFVISKYIYYKKPYIYSKTLSFLA